MDLTRPVGGLPAVLAIDGGNSKTDLALIAEDGSLLASVRGPGSTAPDGTTLAPLVAEVARRAGLDGDGPVARHTSACLANVDLPEEETRLAAELAERGWSQSSQVLNDTFALLRSGTHRPWGVAMVCGAGMNCAGVGPDGRTARFLALGHYTGDWGGGRWLGSEIMYAAIRAEDGRGPETLLRRQVAAYFGEATMHDVAVAVHVGRLGEEEIIKLTRVLFAAADEGDAVAEALVDRQAEEVFLMARSVLDRLDLAGTDVEVVLGGGILASRHPLLTEGVESRLKQHAPAALPCYADVPPVAGAALLGLDHLGAPAEALAQLRASY
ncbi:N-acetylglucosamine kinase-like BadF-type ATPase [Streptacidiphilus sp. MAP12-16]|uniref:N-acetylglucosamine kinase n=1 Tax=Streptacidiphilus sp. MAP12-16 TaxID=3156300 RepID=UPI0035150220